MRRDSPAQQPAIRVGSLAVGGVAVIPASACCPGPLMLIPLGVSGAWIGSWARLKPYRRFSSAPQRGEHPVALATRVADKAGFLGAFISAIGCAACFPALASLGAAIGLGFLTRGESLFITTLIPLFALLAFAANALGWRSHRQTGRLLLGLIGPLRVLSAAFLMRFAHIGTTPLPYLGLAFMPGVSVRDLVSPPVRHCAVAVRAPSANG